MKITTNLFLISVFAVCLISCIPIPDPYIYSYESTIDNCEKIETTASKQTIDCYFEKIPITFSMTTSAYDNYNLNIKITNHSPAVINYYTGQIEVYFDSGMMIMEEYWINKEEQKSFQSYSIAQGEELELYYEFKTETKNDVYKNLVVNLGTLELSDRKIIKIPLFKFDLQ